MGNRWWLKETDAERDAKAAVARRDEAVGEFAVFHKGLTPREKEQLTEFMNKYDRDEELLLHAIRCACNKS